MSLKRNAKYNVEKTCEELRNVKSYLNDATQTIENKNTKMRIQTQLNNIESCLSECENIYKNLEE